MPKQFKDRYVNCTDEAGVHKLYLLSERKPSKDKTVWFCTDYNCGIADGFGCYYVCVNGVIKYGSLNHSAVKSMFNRLSDE